MLRVVFISRSWHVYVAMLALLALLSYLLGVRAIIMKISTINPQNRLPFPELCAVVAAALGATVIRPRFWEWDKIGSRRAGVIAAVCATIGVFAPIGVVVIGSLALPTEVSWTWQAANVLVFASVAFGLAPLIGPGVAGGTTLVLYIGIGALNNLDRSVGEFLPVTPYPGPDGHWLIGLLLAFVAVGVNVATRGATSWSRQMFSANS